MTLTTKELIVIVHYRTLQDGRLIAFIDLPYDTIGISREVTLYPNQTLQTTDGYACDIWGYYRGDFKAAAGYLLGRNTLDTSFNTVRELSRAS